MPNKKKIPIGVFFGQPCRSISQNICTKEVPIVQDLYLKPQLLTFSFHFNTSYGSGAMAAPIQTLYVSNKK